MRRALIIGFLLLAALGLGVVGVLGLVEEHRPVAIIPAAPGGVPYVGGPTITLAARRGGTSFTVDLPRRIPQFATVSVVMRGATAPNGADNKPGQIASVYFVPGTTCPVTSADASTQSRDGVERALRAVAYEYGAFRFADLASVGLESGPAVACGYLGWKGNPANRELAASQPIEITAYRRGVASKREAAFPTGTYVADSGVEGAERVEIRITRAPSPFGTPDPTYFARNVRVDGMELPSCTGGSTGEQGHGFTIDATLSQTRRDQPPAFIDQSVAAVFVAPEKGDLQGGFAGDGRLHGTVTVRHQQGTRSCGGSVGFTAHRVG